jgi:hypothetical protein
VPRLEPVSEVVAVDDVPCGWTAFWQVSCQCCSTNSSSPIIRPAFDADRHYHFTDAAEAYSNY